MAVAAGPGTGKTKTLVSRIAWLIGTLGVSPAEITAVTFTNKAAGELRERLERELGKRAVRGLTAGTFHAICLALLREEREVRLISEPDALALAEQVLKDLGIRDSPRRLLQAVSRRKNGLETADERPEACEACGASGACEAYAERLKQLGVLDFDDLLLEGLGRNGAGDRGFRHLLVDEFQDCNGLQYELVRAWSRAGESLFVIGDPDQSIYGFRGSDARCFQRLEEDRPGVRTIRLARNYRSTPEIIGCALAVIAQNPGPVRALEPSRPAGVPARLVTAESELSEGIFVAREIGRMVGGVDMVEADRCVPRTDRDKPWSFSDMAVLYRTHRQAGLLEKCLRREGIPYAVTGKDDFLNDKQVRRALDFFHRLLSGGLTPEEQAWAARFGARPAREKPRDLLERWAGETGCLDAGPMERLLNTAVFHSDMESFLQNLVLGQEGDIRRSGAPVYDAGAVTLMTLHGAKGLEFPVVFLCGARAGTIPLEAPGRPTDLEEERRLFYVGMTRARDELILVTSREPSPFLADLPRPLLERSSAGGSRRPEGRQLSLFGG